MLFGGKGDTTESTKGIEGRIILFPKTQILNHEGRAFKA